MKRHESIVPLSRDHHLGLLCCWKIRQGIKSNISGSRILSYIQHFWGHYLHQHFQEEEDILFVDLRDELIGRAINEHAALKAYISSLTVNDSADAFLQFAQLLEDHIRFEERVLFPHIEETLPEDKLNMIGKRLQYIHPEKKADNYDDEFWIIR